MMVRRKGEQVTVRIRISGKDAEDVFYPIVNAIKRENRLRGIKGDDTIVYEVETE